MRLDPEEIEVVDEEDGTGASQVIVYLSGSRAERLKAAVAIVAYLAQTFSEEDSA
jgi:hypothetical protein